MPFNSDLLYQVGNGHRHLEFRLSSVARAMSLWGRASRKLGESKTFRKILCRMGSDFAAASPRGA